MKRFLALLLWGWAIQSQGQTTLLVENFDHLAGSEIRNFGWFAHSAGATNPLQVSNFGLTLANTNYYGNNIGNAVLVNNTGSDENKPFGSYIDSGSVYASFLLKPTGTVTSDGSGFFFHFAQYSDPANPIFTSVSTAFRARTFMASGSSPAHFRLGLTFNAAAVPTTVGTDLTSDLDTSKTYLVVVKYTFIAGPDNDEVSLYLFSEGDSIASEPTNPTLGPFTGTAADAVSLQGVALRQYNAAQRIAVDGIYVRTNWDLEASNVSVRHNQMRSTVNIYPNPYNGGVLQIQGLRDENYQIQLRDLSGRLVFEKHQAAGHEISLPQQTAGIYLLYVAQAGQMAVKKLVIH
jgi:hypothetical protein